MFFVDVYAPMTLSAITEKAKSIAKTRVAPDFAFSPSWFYGFCKFFRISCRLAAEASGSDRLEIDELNVPFTLNVDLAAFHLDSRHDWNYSLPASSCVTRLFSHLASSPSLFPSIKYLFRVCPLAASYIAL